MSRKISMRNAIVLITGAGSGMGRLMALEAARRGARKVIIWDMNEERANAVKTEVTRAGAEGVSAIVDVTNADAVAEAAKDIEYVDVLINNAGVVSGRDFLDTTDEQVQRTFNVNVMALFKTTRHFLPAMINRGRGTVVNMASAAGLVGVAKQTDYSASKWAVIGFTESLRVEMKKYHTGVGTLVCCPFYVDTGMFEGVTTKFPKLLPILKQEDVARRVIDGVEQGREEVIMPFMCRLVPLMRILPPPLFDIVNNFLGVNSSMDDFTGRQGDRL